MKRPKRNNPIPLIMLHATSKEEILHNNEVIYFGGLADGRAIVCGEGVYTAQVVSPLVVTDQGIALNWTAPQFRLMSMSILSDDTPTTVDDVTAVVGTSLTASRSDHKHPLGYSATEPAAVDYTQAGTAGTAVTPARSDHRHTIGSTTATVVTNVQYDTDTHKLQMKTKVLTILAAAAESAWSDIATAVDCTGDSIDGGPF